MKSLIILGLIGLSFGEENGLSFLSSNEMKKRLKNQRKMPERSLNHLTQRNSKVTTLAQQFLDRTHSCLARQEQGVTNSLLKQKNLIVLEH